MNEKEVMNDSDATESPESDNDTADAKELSESGEKEEFITEASATGTQPKRPADNGFPVGDLIVYKSPLCIVPSAVVLLLSIFAMVILSSKFPASVQRIELGEWFGVAVNVGFRS